MDADGTVWTDQAAVNRAMARSPALQELQVCPER
jgi:hypothetical protein